MVRPVPTSCQKSVGKDDKGVDGFFGIRPALEVVAKLEKLGREANVGARLGIQSSAAVKFNPPYTPCSGSSTHGTCDRCHRVQGQVSAVGRKLSLEFWKNGRLQRSECWLTDC